MNDKTKKAIHEVKKAFNKAIEKLTPEEVVSVASDIWWNMEQIIKKDTMHSGCKGCGPGQMKAVSAGLTRRTINDQAS